MRVSLAVLCSVFIASIATPHSQDPQIGIRCRIVTSETAGAAVRGTMELTVVNATDATIKNVRLALAPPTGGSLGDGALAIGTIELDETVVRTTDFSLDRAQFDSEDPLAITVSYEDPAGKRKDLTVAARRQTGGEL